jgi:hypothetical protein
MISELEPKASPGPASSIGVGEVEEDHPHDEYDDHDDHESEKQAQQEAHRWFIGSSLAVSYGVVVTSE